MSEAWDSGLAYATNHAEARFLDPLTGGDIEVTVQLAADELFVFDRQSKPRARWNYGEIINAHREGTDRDRVLRSVDNADMLLTILDDRLYAAIRARIPRLRPLRSEGWLSIWNGVPDAAQTAIVIAVIFGIAWLGRSCWAILLDLLGRS